MHVPVEEGTFFPKADSVPGLKAVRPKPLTSASLATIMWQACLHCQEKVLGNNLKAVKLRASTGAARAEIPLIKCPLKPQI